MSGPASADDGSVRSGAVPAPLADAAVWTLRLARGAGPVPGAGGPGPDWALIHALAVRERCDVLCWARSGAIIRRQAPADIQQAWRRGVLADHALRRHQLASLLQLTRALREAGTAPVVLKGAPLAQRLYGDPLVRPTSDLDLYVPPSARVRAVEVLAAHGWRHLQGEAPWEEVFELADGTRPLHCELHYSLRDDALAHLPLPAPPAEMVEIEGESVPAFSGPLLPAYLAAHLVKHQLPPLLWRLDFATLWGMLTSHERAAAERAARDVRLHRYLRWAVRDGRLVEAAIAGDRTAAMALGYARDERRDVHAMVRTAALAATPADAVRVLGAWAWPHNLRRDRQGTAALFRQRLSSSMRRVAVKSMRYGAGGAARPAPPPEPRRALDVPPDELVALVRDVVEQGGTLWIRARGHSMEPTVPSGAMVRVTPLAGRAPRRGEVVFARLPTGVPAVHRAVAVRDGTVRLRGDAQVADDPVIALDDVLGVVDRVAVDGTGVAAAPAGAPPFWRSLAGIARRLRMRLTRVAAR